MSPLQDLYLLSSILGFGYIVGSSLLGSLHLQGGHGAGHGEISGHSHGGGVHVGRAGHAGHGHLGGTSGHSAPGHTSGSSTGSSHGVKTGFGQQSNSHTSPGHTHGTGHGQGAGHAHGAKASHPATDSSSPKAHSSADRQSLTQTTTVTTSVSSVPPLYLKILDILSPTKISLFLFLFGAIGIFSMSILPGYFSLAPALILGWVTANLIFSALGNMLSRMGSSTNFRKDSLIGAMGELTLSIEDGGTGEVMITKSGSRYNGPARPYKEGQTIKKLAKVIIVDIKDGMYYVEPFDDDQV